MKKYAENMDDAVNAADAAEVQLTKTPERMANDEFLDYLMNFSKAGPLAQMIIVTAIDKYLQAVIKDTDLTDTVGWGLVNKREWHRCCKILKEEFDAKYGPKTDNLPR